MKSSQTAFKAGRKFCRTLGEVMLEVKEDRSRCQLGPCSFTIPTLA